MQYPHYGHMGFRDGHGYGLGVIGWLIPLLFLAALVALLVLLFTRLRHPLTMPPGTTHAPPPPPAPAPDAALAHARLRYARGEVSRDEYLQLAADLGGDVQPSAPGPPPA